MKSIIVFLVSVVSVLGLNASVQGSEGTPWGIIEHIPYQPEGDTLWMDKTKEAGIDWIRVDFLWWKFYQDESDSTTFYWNVYDSLARRADSLGLNVLGLLVETPHWANFENSHRHPPDNIQDWYNFVNKVVERYDGDGNDDADGSPRISAWEMWNEPGAYQGWLPIAFA